MIESFLTMAPWISKRDPNLCQDCQYCRKWICRYESCVGCQACHVSCPCDAVKMEERPSGEIITIYFDGKPLQVPSGISIQGSAPAFRLSNLISDVLSAKTGRRPTVERGFTSHLKEQPFLLPGRGRGKKWIEWRSLERNRHSIAHGSSNS